jgi:hypothetical protein
MIGWLLKFVRTSVFHSLSENLPQKRFLKEIYGAGHLGSITSLGYGDEARRVQNSTSEVPDPYRL